MSTSLPMVGNPTTPPKKSNSLAAIQTLPCSNQKYKTNCGVEPCCNFMKSGIGVLFSFQHITGQDASWRIAAPFRELAFAMQASPRTNLSMSSYRWSWLEEREIEAGKSRTSHCNAKNAALVWSCVSIAWGTLTLRWASQHNTAHVIQRIDSSL